MYHWGTGTDADVVDFVVSRRAEELEYAAEQLEYAELENAAEPLSDNLRAGPLAMMALPQALALVTAHWTLIEQIAEAAVSSPAALDYERVMSIAGDSVRPDPTEFERWYSLCPATFGTN